MLNQRETVRISEILRASSKEELIQSIVEDKVSELSYKGVRDLAKEFKEQYGPSASDDGQSELRRAGTAFLYRTLIRFYR
jgi:hypothetical protein